MALDELDGNVEEHVALLVRALVEARDRGRLRTALRTLPAYELRLVLAQLLDPLAEPEPGSVEWRSAAILDTDLQVERLRRAGPE